VQNPYYAVSEIFLFLFITNSTRRIPLSYCVYIVTSKFFLIIFSLNIIFKRIITLYTNIVLREANDNDRYDYKIINLTISLVNYEWADFQYDRCYQLFLYIIVFIFYWYNYNTIFK